MTKRWCYECKWSDMCGLYKDAESIIHRWGKILSKGHKMSDCEDWQLIYEVIGKVCLKFEEMEYK